MIIKINLSNLYATHIYLPGQNYHWNMTCAKAEVTLGAIGAKMVQDHDCAIAGGGSNGAR